MLPRWRTARLAPVLLVALAMPPVAWGADAGLDTRVDQEAGKVSAQLIEVRHRIHQNPELSNREAQTPELVAAHLRALGLEPRTGVGKYGVVALLQGGAVPVGIRVMSRLLADFLSSYGNHSPR